MATAALAQEKVWFDKPSYDKAERLYFERMAKVVSRKIMENRSLKPDNSITENRQNLININNSLSKSKFEKSKDNKTLALDNGSNEIIKHSKCQTKNSKVNKKEDENNTKKTENIGEKEKYDGVDTKEKQADLLNNSSKKYNTKEVKEKKNKADTIHRNKGNEKNDTKEQKALLSNQGNQQSTCPILPASGSLANEVAKARQHIKQSLQCMDDIAALAGVSNQDVSVRIADTEKGNQDLRNSIQELWAVIAKLDERVRKIEERTQQPSPVIAICPPCTTVKEEPTKKDDDDEDVDLFGSDSEGEDAEAAKIREERLAAYAAKKSKKPALIAKSNIILDVKPWDDETDMQAMEVQVREIETDGLLWGAAKLVPLAYGINKLQISCVVEDDKVSVDWLTEKIQELEDLVQSVDIAAFNKV